MDLTYDDSTLEFRDEVRDFLATHKADFPTKSYDTAEGFEQHREWERRLFENRLSMVMWPEALGGRGCDLIEWLIFEEEYFRAGGPNDASRLPGRCTGKVGTAPDFRVTYTAGNMPLIFRILRAPFLWGVWGVRAAVGLWRGKPQRAVNASDDSELKMGDYFDLAADLYGLPRPSRIGRDAARAQLPATLLSFMGESRRMANLRLKRELRVRLRYPTAADGLASSSP